MICSGIGLLIKFIYPGSGIGLFIDIMKMRVRNIFKGLII